MLGRSVREGMADGTGWGRDTGHEDPSFPQPLKDGGMANEAHWHHPSPGSPGKCLGLHLVLAALRADGVPTLSPAAGAAPAPLVCRAAELSSALGRMSQDLDQATFQKCSQVLLQPG